MKKGQAEALEDHDRIKSAAQPNPNALGERVEKLLSGGNAAMAQRDALKLMHELEVHQIELQMQNEALRETQDTLSVSREKYADLYDFAPVGYFTFDPTGLILEANLTGASLLGVNRSQLKGKRFSLFVAAPSQDLFSHHYKNVGQTGNPDMCELQLTREDGTTFYASLLSVPVQDAEGKRAGFRSVLSDITELKRAGDLLQEAHDELEQRVQERTAELSAAVDALHNEIEERRKVEEDLARQAELLNLTHDAIVARDMTNRVFFWNRGAEERYGWTSEELMGKATNEILRTVFPRPWQEIERELLTRGRWEGEVIHTTRDGRKVIVASRRALRRDKEGKPIAILEISSDISEQKHIEEQLRQAQKMESIGTLAGGIAHDFNNILAAVIGFSEIAIDKTPVDSPIRRHLERIFSAGIRGKELVKQILTFSRQAELDKQPLRISHVVKETVGLLRASLPSTIDILTMAEGESGFVLADPTQLQQVVMNLCTNAAHSMRRTGGSISIDLTDYSFSSAETAPESSMSPGLYVKLSVTDTGEGMAQEVLDRVFDPFYTTKAKGEGTGLGLSVVHGIVASHGGAITASSQPGSGSTFAVYLPVHHKNPVTVSDDDGDGDPIIGGCERVLLVDDEEALVEMGREMLNLLGYEVVSETNPEKALERLRLHPSGFDLVITDMTMPRLTGMELAGEILTLRPDMPVILYTGFSHLVNPDAAREAGIRAFVMKPLVKRDIAKTIRKALDEPIRP